MAFFLFHSRKFKIKIFLFRSVPLHFFLIVLLTKQIWQCSKSTKLHVAPLIRPICFVAFATGHGRGSAAATSMHLIMRAPKSLYCVRSATLCCFFKGLFLLKRARARTMRKRKFLLTTSQKLRFLKKKATFCNGGGA